MITLIKEDYTDYVGCSDENIMSINDPLTKKIIACCFKVHADLGPGFKEKIYQNALKVTFEKKRINFDIEKQYRIHYQKNRVGILRVDLVVENKVIVETKAITGHLPVVFRHQLLSYLKVSQLPVGLLVNFGNKSCEVKRLVN